MPTIRAAVCREFGQPLSIEDITLADPGPGELEVTLAACAICHSDISYADVAWGGFLPAVYGHEAAGHVSQLPISAMQLNESPGLDSISTKRSC